MNATTSGNEVKTYTGNAARILELLGSGLSPEVVASAAGVSTSYISQLLSTEDFATQVTALRFQALQEDTARDKRYGKIEDTLLEKMEDILPMMYKPMEILRAITVINGAKRRGASAPESQHINNTVVNITMPTPIFQQFVTNAHNQVVEVVSSQEAPIATVKKEERKTLVTMQSETLLKRFQSTKANDHEANALLITHSSAYPS